MATKAEIVKELAESYGVTASMKSSKSDLWAALLDAHTAAQDAEDTAAESPPGRFNIKQRGQIVSITLGEDEGGQVCHVTRYQGEGEFDGLETAFHAQSYDDVLVSLDTFLKEERRRWR